MDEINSILYDMHGTAHVILIAAMLPGPQAITEELHAVHADGLCAGAGFFQVDAG